MIRKIQSDIQQVGSQARYNTLDERLCWMTYGGVAIRALEYLQTKRDSSFGVVLE